MSYIRKYAPRLIGIVLIIAVLTKSADFFRFSREIESLYNTWLNWSEQTLRLSGIISAALLLIIESGLGLRLIFGIAGKITKLSTIILFGIFCIIAFWSVISNDIDSCGCFGALLQRSPLAALIEDLVFLSIAMLIIPVEKTPGSGMNLYIAASMLFFIVWFGYFYFHPPAWAAIKKGSSWRLKIEHERISAGDDYFVWILDPNCTNCIKKTDVINRFDRRNLDIIALTSASEGRLNEYIFDFEPAFPVLSIKKDKIYELGLISGTLIHINNKTVKRLWRSYQINSDLFEQI